MQAPPPASLQNGALVVEIRLGGLSGPIEATFGAVAAIRPIPRGGFYVVDEQGPMVRKYNDSGEYLGDLGRIGEGPGEFMDVAALAALGNGRTIVIDQQLQRVTQYGPSGGYISDFRLDSRARGYDVSFNLESGDIFTIGRSSVGSPTGEMGSGADWLRVDLRARVEYLRPVAPADREGPFFMLAGAQTMYSYTTMTLGAYGGDGDYWEVRNDTNAILHSHPDGSESSIGLEGPRLPLTAEEHAQWSARARRLADRPGPDRSPLPPIPRVKPYVREIVVDSDGRLWVLRYADPVFVPYSERVQAERDLLGLPDHNWQDRHIWEVFDRSDRRLGAVELPPTVGFHDALGNHIYGVELGDFGEQYVVRYRWKVEGF